MGKPIDRGRGIKGFVIGVWRREGKERADGMEGKERADGMEWLRNKGKHG